MLVRLRPVLLSQRRRRCCEAGTGPYFYLPKMQSHLEARLWNDVFVHAQARARHSAGTIKATVLIETLPAAFEMDEILFELKDHSVGLNCGRWDYIFSSIKTLRERPGLRPARPRPGDDGGAVPAGVHAAADQDLSPPRRARDGRHGRADSDQGRSRRRTTAAMEKVRADKLREVREGHDGTWVAHPALVRRREAGLRRGHAGAESARSAARRRRTSPPRCWSSRRSGTRTEAGLRHNIRVGIQYLEAWLGGQGAVPIYNLMEDAATAEISRTQIWQWLQHRAALDDGRTVTRSLVERLHRRRVHARAGRSRRRAVRRAATFDARARALRARRDVRTAGGLPDAPRVRTAAHDAMQPLGSENAARSAARRVPADKTAIILPEQNIRVTYGALRDQVQAVAERSRRPASGAAIASASRCRTACRRSSRSSPRRWPARRRRSIPAYKEDEFRFYLEDTERARPAAAARRRRRSARGAPPAIACRSSPSTWTPPARCSLPASTRRRRRRRRRRSTTSRSILHTSGSTGRPKRVPLAHANLSISAQNVARSYALDARRRVAVRDAAVPRARPRRVDARDARDRRHRRRAGEVQPAVVLARRARSRRRRGIRRCRRCISCCSRAPTPDAAKPAGAEQLRFIRSCSASLPPQVMHDLEAAFGAPVLEAYGMTEAAHQMASNPLPPASAQAGIGRPRHRRAASASWTRPARTCRPASAARS